MRQRAGKSWVNCDGGCGRQRKRRQRRKNRLSYCCASCRRRARDVTRQLQDDGGYIPQNFVVPPTLIDTLQRHVHADNVLLQRFADAKSAVSGRGFTVPVTVPLRYNAPSTVTVTLTTKE